MKRKTAFALLSLAVLCVLLFVCKPDGTSGDDDMNIVPGDAVATDSDMTVAVDAVPEQTEPTPVPKTDEPAMPSPTPEIVFDAEEQDKTFAEGREVSLHSGIREDGSFAEGTLFLGDSLTCHLVAHYLEKYDLIGEAKYAAKGGAAMTAFFADVPMVYGNEYMCKFSPEFHKMNMAEAAASIGEDAKAIYFMMGTNRMKGVGLDYYIKILDYLLETCPNATIHLQMIPYSTEIDYEEVNDQISEAFEHYRELNESRILLVDTCSAIGEDNLTTDGIHMTDNGRDCWYHALLAHAEDNKLPQ